MFFTSGSLDTYNEHIVADDRTWNAKFNYYYNGDWIEADSSKLKSFQLSDYSTDGSNITMGSVVGGKLTVDLVDVASSIVANIGRGTHIKISFVLGSSATTSTVIIKSGVFVVDDCRLKMKRNGNYNISITAYDLSYKMSKTYVASSSSMTAIEILTEIGNKYGFAIGESVNETISGVDGGTTSFTPLADFTCKQTIGYMAGCYGCFAYFDSDMQLQFGWYKDEGNTVDSVSIFNNTAYVSEMEERTIVMLETGTKDNPIVLPDDANGYSISFENPYITKELATAIYLQKVSNGQLWYRIGKVSYRGNPLNNPGTILYVSDAQGLLYSFYVMKRTLRYDGGLSETIESQGESETAINYKITSPTQQKIDRALSKMEEAIKKATDIITQTKGSVFEFIPIDESDPTKGNSGWKLYSTEIGSNNLILANSSGIGFSSNGGQSFNAMAMYIDENGIGHINANCIDVGKLSADVIDTSTLVVSKSNVDGLDTELQTLLDAAEEADKKASNAQTTASNASSTASTALSTANSANTTANTASSNASNALSVANSANGKIANWASANDTTLIDGAKIYTGSITAQQIASESITADKLSVGTTLQITLFNNTEFNLKQSDGTSVSWNADGGTLQPQDGWMIFKPSSSGLSSIYQNVWLRPGRYALVARVNPYNISAVSSSSSYFGWSIKEANKTTRTYHTHGQDKGQITENSWLLNKNTEITIKQVFDYTGEEGFTDVGFALRGFTFSGYLTLAWCALFEAPDESVGFYASNSNLLSIADNLISNSNNLSDVKRYVRAFYVDTTGQLDVMGGRLGAFDFSRQGLYVTSHIPLGIMGIGFTNSLEIGVPIDGLSNSISNTDDVAYGKATSPYIYYHDDDYSQESFLAIYGFYCTNSSYSSYVHPQKIKTTGTMEATAFNDTSREKHKQNIELKSSVLDKIKSSKIYEYFYKQDGQSAKRKTGFIVERETPEDVISDDGNGINLYSMASMNWKATQELLERLEAVEKAVNTNA